MNEKVKYIKKNQIRKLFFLKIYLTINCFKKLKLNYLILHKEKNEVFVFFFLFFKILFIFIKFETNF